MSECLFCNTNVDLTQSRILETSDWQVLLHADQSYLGRSTVLLKRHCGALSELNETEWLDLKNVIEQLERGFRLLFKASLCNWSSLMNAAYQVTPPVPHVHFHVRPRYQYPVEFHGLLFVDHKFGEHYTLTSRRVLPPLIQAALISQLRAHFAG